MDIKNLDVLLMTTIREESFYSFPPIGLGYLATALRRENFKVDILDTNNKKFNFVKLRQHIEKINPRIIGIQVFSYDVNPCRKLINIIDELNPDIKIILGGPHPTSEPSEVFNQFKYIDYAFKGEGEEGLPILVNYLLRNKKINLKTIPGLIWKENNEVIINNQIFNSDLDKYGIPAWDLIDPRQYEEAPQGGFLKEFPYAPISTSRGCPFRCTYCAVHIMNGRKIRYRSVQLLIDEIKYLNGDFGVKEFHIIDDAFTSDKKRVVEFCNELFSNNLTIRFTFPNGIRLDTLDKEMLFKMKQAGLQDFHVGIESGSDKILKDMRKNLTTKIIEEKINLIKKVGLEVNGFFIIGYPTETKEDILKTIKFAKKLPIKRAQFNLFNAFAGTEITNYLFKTRKINKINYDQFIFYKVDYIPEGMTKKELSNLQKKAFLEFYLRPKIILDLLKDINSFTHFKFIMRRIKYSLFVSK